MGTRLKYDRKTARAHKILMIVFSCMFILSLAVTLVLDRYSLSELPVGAIVAASFFLFVSAPLALFFTDLSIRSGIYLRRLSDNGYQVPYVRTECNGVLENIPRGGEAVVNRYASDSRISAFIAVAALCISVFFDVIYVVKWTVIGETDCIAGFIFLLILHCILFIIPAAVFFRQRSTECYRDEVDIAYGKKARTSICSAITVLLILSMVAAFATVQVDNITNYIHKSRTETNLENMR